MRVCARARVSLAYAGVQSSSVVVQAKSPRYILFKRLPWPPWQRVFALRHLAALLFPPSSLSLSLSPSLSLSLSLYSFLSSAGIEHDRNTMEMESNNRAKVFFFSKNFGIELPVSFLCIPFASVLEGRGETYPPLSSLPGRRWLVGVGISRVWQSSFPDIWTNGRWTDKRSGSV